jgi:mevalonate kinase
LIKISAPYRIYLIGEHASVYGEPALLLATQYRLSLTLNKSKNISYVDHRFGLVNSWPIREIRESTNKVLGLWNSCAERGDFSELNSFIRKDDFLYYRKSVIGIALNYLKLNSGVTVHIETDLPFGSGLASSAALAVSLAKGLAELHDLKSSFEKTNRIAYELEKIIHCTPSGGDNSICCFGGLLWFQNLNHKNKVIQLKDDIPKEFDDFILVYTKPPEKTTGELVQLVRNLDNRYREARIKKIGELVHEMKGTLKNNNFKRMVEILNEDQRLLSELGVSCKEIDDVSDAVKKIGGAAKLSGAGGGGAMLCYHHENKQKLMETVKNLGYGFWDIKFSLQGVRKET